LILFDIKIVPQQQACIIEKVKKCCIILGGVLSFIIQFINKVVYKYSLKEKAIDILQQVAIVKDDVALSLDGVLYIMVINFFDVSYKIKILTR